MRPDPHGGHEISPSRPERGPFAGGGSLTGVGVGETAQVTGTITITGGTGRFADASGTLTGTFDVETLSLVGTTVVNLDTFTVEGRISY